MTKQIHDTFIYEKTSAKLLALSPDFDFSPKDFFDLEPSMWGTANYRGFWCGYKIENGILFIDELTVYIQSGDYPIINNIKAIPDELIYQLSKKSQFRIPIPRKYKDIHYHYYYTGKLVIAVNQQEDKYDNIGKQIILELQVNQGKVDSTKNISSLWKQYKQKHLRKNSYWWQAQDKSYDQFVNFRSWLR